jgi:hypothetical protein
MPVDSNFNLKLKTLTWEAFEPHGEEAGNQGEKEAGIPITQKQGEQVTNIVKKAD